MYGMKPLPSVMTHQFDDVARADISRTTFNRDHSWKSTVDASYLIPVFHDQVYPGETHTLKVQSACRLLTPLKYPILDRLEISFFFFAVPNRLVWRNWVKMQGEREDPADSIDFTSPKVTPPSGGWTAHSLGDFFGLRTGTAGEVPVNAYKFRAYNLIYNTYFRCQNYIDSIPQLDGDGPDAGGNYYLKKRAKKPDYFTTLLPTPQKGDAVQIPLGSSAPVIGDGQGINIHDGTTLFGLRGSGSGQLESDSAYVNRALGWTGTGGTQAGAVAVGLHQSTTSHMIANLSDATAATINEWREAFQLQRILERDARCGSRYYEAIQAHFNVTDPQAAVLDRPEYIGGGTGPFNIVPVAQTSESGTTDQGHLSAVAFGESQNRGFTKSFTEHCVILGLAQIRCPDLTYQQGNDREWYDDTRYDFYLPATAHLGEQEVYNRELFVQNTSADTDIAGYQERWSHLRTKKSLVCGQLRSDHATPLDSWHLSEDFASLPTIGQTFLEDQTPIARVVADQTAPEFLLSCWFDYKSTRPMPAFSTPGLIDHF